MFSWLNRLFGGGPSAKAGGGAPDWQRAWDARLRALEALLGPADPSILTSPVPIYLGGSADVLTFRSPPGGGVAYVTAGLTATSDQPPSTVGNYELMIRAPVPDEVLAGVIGGLSNYTLGKPLNPGDVIDLGERQPPGVTIRALLAVEPDPPAHRFAFLGREYALLLLVGITSSEYAAVNAGQVDRVLALLRRPVLPFTDLRRPAVV